VQRAMAVNVGELAAYDQCKRSVPGAAPAIHRTFEPFIATGCGPGARIPPRIVLEFFSPCRWVSSLIKVQWSLWVEILPQWINRTLFYKSRLINQHLTCFSSSITSAFSHSLPEKNRPVAGPLRQTPRQRSVPCLGKHWVRCAPARSQFVRLFFSRKIQKV